MGPSRKRPIPGSAPHQKGPLTTIGPSWDRPLTGFAPHTISPSPDRLPTAHAPHWVHPSTQKALPKEAPAGGEAHLEAVMVPGKGIPDRPGVPGPTSLSRFKICFAKERKGRGYGSRGHLQFQPQWEYATGQPRELKA